MAPIFADGEAGFGGNLNAFELMKCFIDAGAAAVHFEDQLSSAKKCGHLGGKVVIPVQEAINKLVAARLAADVEGVPSIVVARTDAESGKLLSSNVDERDHPFIKEGAERTAEGFKLTGTVPWVTGAAYAKYVVTGAVLRRTGTLSVHRSPQRDSAASAVW